MLTLQDKQGNVVTEVYDSRYDKEMMYVSTHLRQSDFDEVFAATGDSPHLTVLEGWELSSKRFMIFNGHAEPVAVLGVNPVPGRDGWGVIWLLGTDGLDKMKKFFVTISKPIIKELSLGYKLLVNFVDSRYVKTVRWLKWCGFTIEPPTTVGGRFAVPFHKVYLEVANG
jgi:hypothetical protein